MATGSAGGELQKPSFRPPLLTTMSQTQVYCVSVGVTLMLMGMVDTFAPSIFSLGLWLRALYTSIGSLMILAVVDDEHFSPRKISFAAGSLLVVVSAVGFIWSSNLRQSVFHFLIGSIGMVVALIEQGYEKLWSQLPPISSDSKYSDRMYQWTVTSRWYLYLPQMKTDELQISGGLLLILLVEALGLVLMVLRFIVMHR